MNYKFRGKAHIFGKNIDTDQIYPAKYLDIADTKEIAKHCMEGADLSFALKIKPGDIIIAGTNFGCGSSREHAPVSIKGCGVSLVIAQSFARIFYRNSINVGLPILVCSSIADINQGDTLSVDLNNGLIKNVTKGTMVGSEKFPAFMQDIIKAKGLINWIQQRQSGSNRA